MHFWVDILIVLYIFGFGTARLGEWRLNHIHSINGAEVINASVSDSSAEIDYSASDVESDNITCHQSTDNNVYHEIKYTMTAQRLYICCIQDLAGIAAMRGSSTSTRSNVTCILWCSHSNSEELTIPLCIHKPAHPSMMVLRYAGYTQLCA